MLYFFFHTFICLLNHGQYPYKWLCDYAGDKFLKPEAKKSVGPRPITTSERISPCSVYVRRFCVCERERDWRKGERYAGARVFPAGSLLRGKHTYLVRD
jgi:hypothetical protein